ncbi:MAG: HPr family phosphocarrier protein [Spirochaetales bacterium]|nr:HPr family phosphocarrier protein [Spirochaetales bacterium]
MVECLVTIKNRAGIHARPAALLVQTATQFSSKIIIEKDTERINGKSIMGVISLGATYNSQLKLIVEGADEQQAIAALVRLFENKFQEE